MEKRSVLTFLFLFFTGILIQASTKRFAADSCEIAATAVNPPVLPYKPDVVIPDFTLGDPHYAWVDEEMRQYSVVPDITSARNAPIWTLPYTFNASPIGAATVSIPIYAPKGTGLATPQLTLSYNSQTGNGIMGMGFSIGGLSCISRGPRDIWHDGTAHGVDLSNDDALYLDGKRLVLRNGTAMTPGATYSPEDSPFTTVTFVSDNGITGFTLRTEDGHTMTFGGNENSTFRVLGNDGKGIAYAWNARETTDSNGNATYYKYRKDGAFFYISEIDYGYNKNNPFGIPANKMHFYYEQRPDAYPVNIAGVTGKMDCRLKYIETSSSDSIYLVYNLSYQTDHVSGRSQLCNVSASKNFDEQFCMLQLGWNMPGSVDASLLDIYADNTVLDNKRHIFSAADINGDGISDIIEVQYGYRQADIGNNFGKVPTTYCTPYISATDNCGNATFSRGRTLDIGEFLPAMKGGILSLVSANGQHADIVIPELNTSGNSDHLSLHVLTGGSGGLIDSHKTEPFLQLAARHKSVPLSAILDTDNDGHSEILILENSPSPQSDNLYGYYTIKYPAKAGELDYSSSSIVLTGTPKRLFAADFNNDGMTDVMVVTDKGYTMFLNRGYGSIGSWKRVNGITVSDAPQLEFGDFNGDGVADFVSLSGSSLTVLTGDGKGNFTAEKKQAISELSGNTDKEFGQILVYDFNSDGRSDIVATARMKSPYNGSQTLWLQTSDNGAFTMTRRATSKNMECSRTGRYTVGDFNGDGIPELMNYGYDSLGGNSDTSSPAFYTYTNGFTAGTGKLSSIVDYFGNRTSIEYASMATGGIYTCDNDASLPVVDITPPVSAVKSVRRTNGAAGANTIEYSYCGLKVHMQGKGILGMRRVEERNADLGISASMETARRDDASLLPALVLTRKTEGSETSTCETSYSIFNKGNKCFASFPVKTVTTDYDGNVSTLTRKYNSENGYLLLEQQEQSDGSYEESEYSGYGRYGNMWLAGTAITRRKHADDRNEWTDTSTFTYDENGNMLTATEHAGTDKEISAINEYDIYGNVVKRHTEGCQVVHKVNIREYDETGRFIVKTYTEPASTAFEYECDPFGNVHSVNDVTYGDRGLKTEYRYDEWGRRYFTLSPTGMRSGEIYGWDTSGKGVYYTLRYGLGTPWVKTWHDSTGRELASETMGIGNVKCESETTYDRHGNVSSVTTRKGKLTLTKKSEYDSRGRIVKDASNSGSVVTYVYGNRRVAVCDNGRKSAREYDPWGNIKVSTDSAAAVEYMYFSSGMPSSVTCNGNTVRMEYDAAGNRTVLDDPDAGRHTYTYDAEGRLLSHTDGRGVTVNNVYDRLGRLVQATGADAPVEYTMDLYGNVTEAVHGGNTVNRTYDKFGRLVSELCSYDGEYTSGRSFAYDRTNNVTDIKYSSGAVVSNNYDTYGNCTRRSVGDDTIWEFKKDDGITTVEDFLNGRLQLTETRTGHGFLSSDALKSDSGKEIAIAKYTFDPITGNLTERQMPRSSLKEKFYYDNLDRLVSYDDGKLARRDSIPLGGVTDKPWIAQTNIATIILPDRPASAKVNLGIHDYKYSTDGNIVSVTGYGTYSYSARHPHAVETVTNSSGNISAMTQEVEYNLIGKAGYIHEGKDADSGYTLSIGYGPDGERFTTTLSKDGKIVKKIRFSPDGEYMEEDGCVREFTYLGKGLLYYRENGSEGKLLYMLSDHQGSVTGIYDADGSELFRASYSPWGAQQVSKNEIGFIRGYTGHEMLREFSLINMNGRLYDPLLGRFLSPDNFVQMPESSQSFNRYSYCLNNPLKYTDPSGEFWNLAFGAAIGGLFNWASHGFKFNAKGIGYFFTGAVAGAISTGIASGVNVAMAGGSFWAGAAGMANGISSTGFLSGAAAGAASGFAGGFVSGFGNSLIDGSSFEKGILTGLDYGLESGFAGGIFGGIAAGIDALDKGTNFWDGTIKVSMDGAFSCMGNDLEGIWDNLKEECQDFVGKYVGDYEGQPVYESKILGTYSEKGGYRGFTRPDEGIFVGKKVFTGNSMNGRAMMQHEFGHVLQYRIVGAEKYYNVIAKESSLNCAKIPPYNKISHDLFWTETWANYLSKQYFGITWHGLEINTMRTFLRYYPARNLTKAFRIEKFGF